MQRNNTHLAAAGPLSDVGFPLWYRDSTGERLELGLDPGDPNLPAMGDVPQPGLPLAIPGNFPDEAFYFLAEASLTTGGTPVAGRARVILALEAAFATPDGSPEQGRQAVFGRIRYRIDGARPDTAYVFTHPYGQSDPIPADERGRVFFTEDIEVLPGNFDAALRSEIGPFLRWTAGAPAGYLGDGATPHAVTGSPFGTNHVIIEGPDIGSGDVDGGPTRAPGEPDNRNKVYTELFVVQGRRARVAGVQIDRAAYHRPVAGPAILDVVAGTEPGQQLVVAGATVPATTLRNTGPIYLARTTVTGDPRGMVSVTNTSDTPPTLRWAQPADVVTVVRAGYDTGTRTLTVEARSSDEVAAAVLTAEGHGLLGAGPTEFAGLDAVAPTITVSSSLGGSATVPVAISGPALAPQAVTAAAGPDQTVQQGQTVILDGTSSGGAIATFAWARTAGPAVALTGAITPNAGFVAPAAGSALTLTLTVDGPGGTDTDGVVVTVGPLTAPMADAGPARTVAVGDRVTLDGSASAGAATFAWVPTPGATITDLTGADTAHPSFTMPAGPSPLVLTLTVTGPGGPASSATVTVTPRADNLILDRVQYRLGSRQWRVGGRADGTPPDRVTVRFGGVDLGTAPVDATGAWDVRRTLTPGETTLVPANGAPVEVVSSRGGQATGSVMVRS